jgi:acetyl-CoA carboxylase carboxyl transferase subunit alpha
MKLTAADLLNNKIADAVIDEPEGGAKENPMFVIGRVGDRVQQELVPLMKLTSAQLLRERYRKYREIGL